MKHDEKKIEVEIVPKSDEYEIKFSMGVQSFTLDYKVEEKEEIEWMKNTLEKFFNKYAEHMVQQERERIVKEFNKNIDIEIDIENEDFHDGGDSNYRNRVEAIKCQKIGAYQKSKREIIKAINQHHE